MRERQHSIVDLVVLLAAIALALATWSYVSNGVSPWKAYTSVVVTALFGLASLTRHPHWATSIRLLMGGWIMAAPYVLGFADIAPALWVYLAIGSLVAMVAIPGIAVLCARLARSVSDQIA